MRIFITWPCLFVLTKDKVESEHSREENDPFDLGKWYQFSILQKESLNQENGPHPRMWAHKSSTAACLTFMSWYACEQRHFGTGLIWPRFVVKPDGAHCDQNSLAGLLWLLSSLSTFPNALYNWCYFLCVVNRTKLEITALQNLAGLPFLQPYQYSVIISR